MKELVSINKRKLKTKGCYSLFLCYEFEGKRRKRYLNLHLRQGATDENRLAMQEAQKHRLELIKELELGCVDRGRITFSTYVKQMGGVFEINTQRAHNAAIKLVDAYSPNIRMKDIDRRWFAGFVNFLRARKNHVNTINTRCNFVKSVLHRAFIDGVVLNRVDTRGLIPSVRKPNRIFLSLDELRLLIQTPLYREDVKQAFLFACFTGLRESDIYGLLHSNITNNILEVLMKKTKETIRIPLSKNALKFLPAKTSSEPLVFPSLPKSVSHLNRIIRRWARDAGVGRWRQISMHIARHTFACLLAQNGADLYLVQNLLGHRKIETTLIYAKCVMSQKRDAVNKIPLI
ncbi:Site-specific recombinase XerD [Fibrobacter sp. UWH9]|uniref:tyrosine-type recombinase/integrase n=1 Tax=unclassified Fibrobacter TaxID=2634177 RepID=UPI00091E08BE|nr:MULTISPECIES: site-specific integrase [unclassified Fibrobacter]SHH43394.1 Site-specific recombinase XerD [Fibrobacter sp. UWH9]SHL36216.1 Site-specific recombinase XerD [Fibrobacter sp. UWH6]